MFKGQEEVQQVEVMVNLPKVDFSESVVRKALYWMTEEFAWKLDQDRECWIVTVSSSEQNMEICRQTLDRLLNDFLLREKLDAKTKGLREKIVLSALRRLSDGPNG